jgi:hypothetical protein
LSSGEVCFAHEANVLTVLIAARATSKFTFPGQTEPLPFNDPTAVALASLGIISCAPHNKIMRDTLLDAGGIPPLVRILRESSEPLTRGFARKLMLNLMLHVSPSEEAADQFVASGERCHGLTKP